MFLRLDMSISKLSHKDLRDTSEMIGLEEDNLQDIMTKEEEISDRADREEKEEVMSRSIDQGTTLLTREDLETILERKKWT